MKIWLNEQAYKAESAGNVEALIAELSLPINAVAVAINGDIVPRHQWQDTPLEEGLQIAVFQAIAGG
ncbi:thiamine biosynthesis protein ThiS [Enterovibrio norvegicus]|uniref:sulfur carrier protein ThiS n=1 Tax=Enterovibrio norvegicus TaxID=188144 RepID=UPI0002E89F4D|nr:sulfur carrier protein ThiS [Enterovibrio norvegicus]OEE50860.1 thiamine biosynthesis protein ThiS [Enterovibrio norvegicus]PMH60999.1 thiamine biosynthesis protein ThiS [Enterovibrio norvegicus]